MAGQKWEKYEVMRSAPMIQLGLFELQKRNNEKAIKTTHSYARTGIFIATTSVVILIVSNFFK